MAKKRTERQKAISYADEWFSKWTRRRFANDKGFVACYTCGRKHRWTEGRKINCGHFMSRGKMATRWHENNARPQCVGCNKYKSGRQYEFGLKLDAEDEGLAERMRILSEKTCRRSTAEIREIGAEYRRRLEQLL